MEYVAVITASIAALTSIITLVLNRKWQKDDRRSERNDKCAETLHRIEQKLDAHIKTDTEDNIKQSRTQFLIFADEVSRGVWHSKEHFEAIMELVDAYDRYCQANPNFPNSKARAAEKLIKDEYQKHVNLNDW